MTDSEAELLGFIKELINSSENEVININKTKLKEIHRVLKSDINERIRLKKFLYEIHMINNYIRFAQTYKKDFKNSDI